MGELAAAAQEECKEVGKEAAAAEQSSCVVGQMAAAPSSSCCAGRLIITQGGSSFWSRRDAPMEVASSSSPGVCGDFFRFQ